MASLALPSESRIAFSIKNTFIDSFSDDDLPTDNQPSRALRSFTAPVAAVSDSEASEESDTDCDREDAPALPTGPPALARVPEAGLLPTVTVKNTFVDLPDRSPSIGQAMLSRCITAPVRSGSFSTCSSDEEDSLPAPSSRKEVANHDGAFLPCGTPAPWGTKSTDSDLFVPCSTPTPWGTRSAELSFLTLAGGRPAPPAPVAPTPVFPAPVFPAPEVPPPVAPAPVALLPEAPAMHEAAGKAEGKITASAQDKSLAIRQAGDSCLVQWTVQAKKLRSNVKQVVSAPFELTLREGAAPAVFKMVLYGQSGNIGTSFQKSGGVGCLQLKCCSELSEEAQRTISVHFCVGGGIIQAPRGPVAHDFHSCSACTLPKHQSIWDFGASIGQSTFTVSVELSPVDLARSFPR